MMLQPSSRLYYGLQGLLDLARQPAGTPCSSRELAARQGIPVKYLESLIGILRHAGLIQSFRGAGGGHLLARPPHRITLRDVFAALEGTAANESGTESACFPVERCVTRSAWAHIVSRALVEMERVTIADLVHECRALESGTTPDYHI